MSEYFFFMRVRVEMRMEIAPRHKVRSQGINHDEYPHSFSPHDHLWE